MPAPTPPEYGYIYVFTMPTEAVNAYMAEFMTREFELRWTGENFQIITSSTLYSDWQTACGLLLEGWTGTVLKDRDGLGTIQNVLNDWKRREVDVRYAVGAFAFQAKSVYERCRAVTLDVVGRLQDVGYTFPTPLSPLQSDSVWDSPISADLALAVVQQELEERNQAMLRFDSYDKRQQLLQVGNRIEVLN